MIIDCKLTILKNYLSESRLSNAGVKTTIDQSAVAASEQNNVDLELDDGSKNSHDSYNKKKQDSQDSQEESEEKREKIVLSDQDIREKNMLLLNLI